LGDAICMTMPTHITLSGGLLTHHLIEAIRQPEFRHPAVEPASFALPGQKAPSPRELEDTIAAAWELLCERWDAIAGEIHQWDVSTVRERWLRPLFTLLDFELAYQRADTLIGEGEDALRFPISHRGYLPSPAAQGASRRGAGDEGHLPSSPPPSPLPFSRSPDGDRRKGGGNAPPLPSPKRSGGEWERGLGGESQLPSPIARRANGRGVGGEGLTIPIHTVAPTQDLDARQARGRGVKAKSPHDMLQLYLNLSREHTWAILTNGIHLRLLRDYHHTYTKGYVEFDLEGIFESRDFADFRALYRLCHASRFIPTTARREGEPEAGPCPLELLYEYSQATGIKVGEDLRENVVRAIETLGNGFLTGALIPQLQDDPELCRRFFAELLVVIYRMLFLLFAEQRGMLPGRNSLYMDEYSITALRARAERPIPDWDDHVDLWERLKVTFHMLKEGVPELGIFGYNGALFDDDKTPLLDGLTCRNAELLRAVRYLTTVEREGVLQRISYADLSVEEIGSIYESLLDYTPRVTKGPETINGRYIPADTFVLDPRGSARKTTGSYYTHPSLVNALVESALVPVMEQRLAEALGREAGPEFSLNLSQLSPEERTALERAILSIKVCDPACGSGAFLIAATNTLAQRLAQIRTGDEYPPEREIRKARRDVLAHCIYGVDLNPMAVELCKVSLWINAAVEDAPLNFLDHHIKCGNSLIGATPELMEEGIPNAAFDPITGDDKAVARAVKKRNRKERAGQIPLWKVTVLETMEDLERWRELNRLAQEAPALARERYREYLAGQAYRERKVAADVWTAAFFWPLVSSEVDPPTEAVFRQALVDPTVLDPDLLERIEELARRYRFFHWHLEFPDVFQPSPRRHLGGWG